MNLIWKTSLICTSMILVACGGGGGGSGSTPPQTNTPSFVSSQASSIAETSSSQSSQSSLSSSKSSSSSSSTSSSSSQQSVSSKSSASSSSTAGPTGPAGTYEAGNTGEIINQLTLNIGDGSTLKGGTGNDDITFWNANVQGGAGNDIFRSKGTWGAVVFWNSPKGISVNLAEGKAEDGFGGTDTLIGVQNIHGSNFDDVIIGNDKANSFHGGGGNDRFEGGGEFDVVSYFFVKSTDATISYDKTTDTWTVVKNFANDKGTDILKNIDEVHFTGEGSDYVQIKTNHLVAVDGFLLKKETLKTSVPVQGAYPSQMKTGDFNGDGLQDILVVTQAGTGTEPAPMYIFLGQANGQLLDATENFFQGKNLVEAGGGRTQIGDFNRDGKDDIFQLGFGNDAPPFPGGTNSLYLSQKSSLAFVNASQSLPQTLELSHGGSVGDLNGDGFPDVLVNTLSSGANIYYLNDGTGHFTVSQHLLPSKAKTFTYTQSQLVDINNDNALDMILGGWFSEGTASLGSSVYLNKGNGDFSQATEKPLPSTTITEQGVLDIKTINLNGDNLPDLMMSVTRTGGHHDSDTWYRPAYIQLLINKGDGNFVDESATRLPANITNLLGEGINNLAWIFSLTAVDINKDGKEDIFVEGTNDAHLTLLVNNGQGNFSKGWQSADQSHTVAKTIEINHDGKPDIVKASATSEGFILSVYLNQN